MTAFAVGSLARARGTALGRAFPAHVRESGLIAPGDAVLVALSGGLDSVVLLHLLRFLVEDWQLELGAAHFDHRMRPGSEADAEWVAALCRAWGVPLERGAARRSLRSEAAARAARYRFLRAAARRRGAGRLTTAHHADDQAETVLFRILRGTGLSGLRGIPARRGRIVRPLLPFRRAQVEEYAHAAELAWREDPTNRILSFARNRIRHEVLPLLEQVTPGATGALLRLAEHARDAEAAWDAVLEALLPGVIERVTDEAVELARPRLLAYHSSIRARLLRRLLRRYGSVPDRAGTMAALEFISGGASGGQMRLAGGVRLEREFDRIRLRRATRAAPAAPEQPLVIAVPGGAGRARIGGRRVEAHWTSGTGEDVAGAETFDAGSLRFPLELRGWHPGDRIRLPSGSKKLKKLFLERRVGRSERARVPLLVDAGGRILWAVGLARAAGLEPRPGHASFAITVEDAEHG